MFSVCVTHESNSGTFTQEMFENQWSYLFEIITPNKIYIKDAILRDGECTWNADPIIRNTTHELITDYSSISENIVYLTSASATALPGEINLKDFTHPSDNVCYVFGPNNGTLTSSVAGDKVYIETDNDWQYYNWMVGAILFYDRRNKLGNL